MYFHSITGLIHYTDASKPQQNASMSLHCYSSPPLSTCLVVQLYKHSPLPITQVTFLSMGRHTNKYYKKPTKVASSDQDYTTHTAQKDLLMCYLTTFSPVLPCSFVPLLLSSFTPMLPPLSLYLFSLLMSRVITVGPGQRERGMLRRRRQNRRREGVVPA